MTTVIPPPRFSSLIHPARRAWKLGLFAVGALWITSGFASGAVISETFRTPGGLPANWSYVSGNLANTPPVIDANGDGIVFRRDPTAQGGANSNGAIFYTGPTGGTTDGVIEGDFTAQVTLTLSGTSLGPASTQGVFIGASGQAYNSQGIYVGFYASDASRGLGIWQNPVNNSDAGAPLGFSVLGANLARDVPYTLHLSFSGGVLSAWLTTAGETSPPLASVNASGLNNLSGYFGLRTGFANTGVITTFSDVTVTTIPEPRTLIWAGIGLLGYFLVRGRGRRVLRNV